MSQHIKPYIYRSILALVILATIRCSGKSTSLDNASPTGSTDQGKVYNLQISRYTTASIDNSSVDAILQNATTAICL